jgi:sulfur-carrier protein adenylyltransferase/sulfurtransferase
MNGGIDAWNGVVSTARTGQGMYLIEGDETIEEIVALAYGLEEGSRRFYRGLAERSNAPEAKRLFEALHDAEIRHEERLWERYRTLAGDVGERTEFEDTIVPRALEGGLTPDQMLSRYPEMGKGFADSLDMAMVLENDALDLYLRMAAAFDDREIRSLFFALAREEREHLEKLGTLRGREP